MASTKYVNGVKARADGQGELWANEHRAELGAQFNMNDIDGLIGLVGFAANTGNRLFVEYVPDGTFQDRFKSVRGFAVVALFDRKLSVEAAFGTSYRVSQAFYLYLCRSLSEHQPKPPKFFYVIGSRAPYTLIELDITTGDEIKRYYLEDNRWKDIWEATGLVELRKLLLAWIGGNGK